MFGRGKDIAKIVHVTVAQCRIQFSIVFCIKIDLLRPFRVLLVFTRRFNINASFSSTLYLSLYATMIVAQLIVVR